MPGIVHSSRMSQDSHKIVKILEYSHTSKQAGGILSPLGPLPVQPLPEKPHAPGKKRFMLHSRQPQNPAFQQAYPSSDWLVLVPYWLSILTITPERKRDRREMETPFIYSTVLE